MTAESSRFSSEPSPDLTFEFAYGMVGSRLQEAMGLQVREKQSYVWLETYPDIPGITFAAILLAQNYRDLIERGSEHFTIALPISHEHFDDEGHLDGYLVAESAEPYFVLSEALYGDNERRVVTPAVFYDTSRSGDSPLGRLNEKLLTFQTIPFRLRSQTA